VKRSSEAGFVD